MFKLCFQTDGINAFWVTIHMLKSGACGGPFLKIHRKYFFEQPARILSAKNRQ
jgi:hypothetical protein